MSSYSKLEFEFSGQDFTCDEIESVLFGLRTSSFNRKVIDERRKGSEHNYCDGSYAYIFCESLDQDILEEEILKIVESLEEELGLETKRVVYYVYDDTGSFGKAFLLIRRKDEIEKIVMIKADLQSDEVTILPPSEIPEEFDENPLSKEEWLDMNTREIISEIMSQNYGLKFRSLWK
jgi:hypothetical protein